MKKLFLITIITLAGNSVLYGAEVKNVKQKKLTISKQQLDKLLLMAAKEGDLKKVRLALKYGANINAQEGSFFERLTTPLLWAIYKQHMDIVQELLNNGALNINLPDSKGQTPLMEAIRYKNPEIVRLLLERPDINIDAPDNEGDTAFNIAQRYLAEKRLQNWGREAIVALDEQEQAILTLLTNYYNAASLGEIRKVGIYNDVANIAHEYSKEPLTEANKRLIEADQDLIAAFTSLYAPYINKLRYIELVLDRGARVDVTNEMGRTPLMRAALQAARDADKQDENIDIIRLLLKRGANVQLKDNNGKTALDLVRPALAKAQADLEALEERMGHGYPSRNAAEAACYIEGRNRNLVFTLKEIIKILEDAAAKKLAQEQKEICE